MSSVRARIGLPYHLSSDAYHDLIAAVGALSTRFGLVLRNRAGDGEGSVTVMSALASHLEDSRLVSEWPGTRSGEVALVNHYAVTAESLAVLSAHSEGFWDWVAPDMPEDLHFLRADGSVVLGSTQCERYSWLEVGGDEFAGINLALPADTRLGGFDPLEELDGWLAAYRADLECDGAVRIVESAAGLPPQRLIKVQGDHQFSELSLDASGAVVIVTSRDGRKTTQCAQTRSTDELQPVLTHFLDVVAHGTTE